MDKFNLKFQGEILPGHDLARVKKKFALAFHIDDPKRVDAFFTGREITLRRNLVKDDAANVFVSLRKIGVVTHIEKVEPPPPAVEQTQVTPAAVPPESEAAPEPDVEVYESLPQMEVEEIDDLPEPPAEKVEEPPEPAPQISLPAEPPSEPVFEQTEPEPVAEKPAEPVFEAPAPAPEPTPAPIAELPPEPVVQAPTPPPPVAVETPTPRAEPVTEIIPEPIAARVAAQPEPADEDIVLESQPAGQAVAGAALKQAIVEAPARRKRQPGAPNLFDLRLSSRAGVDDEPEEKADSPAIAPLLAAAIALLAFVLVGARFWSQSQADAAIGLGYVAVDPRQQPVVQVNQQLLWHDRAGISTKVLDLKPLEAYPLLAFDFFSNGDLLLLHTLQNSGAPNWLRALWGAQTRQGNALLRCQADGSACKEIASSLGEAAFLIDQRTDRIYLADPASDTLSKLDQAGVTIASKPMELSAPLHLRLQEGILYLTQAESDAVTILKPDDRDFGLQLDKVSLKVDDASQSGHIFPAETLYVNEQWWTVMQSRDGSNAGLYLFTSRWQFERSIELPPTALPSNPTRWAAKVLVSDTRNENIYRFDATAQRQKDFTSDTITTILSSQRSALSTSQTLQAIILMMLFGVAAGLLALGILFNLRGKIYSAPSDKSEEGFDINNESIEWLAPAPQVGRRLKQLGYSLAALAALLLVGAFLLQLSIWAMLAMCLLMVGIGGLYFALLRATNCHMGVLDDQLILVDHTNTYRVGSGPKIQHFNNYVMIDDVIVYLGNPLVQQFASEPLQQIFLPMFNTGIKVDRATLRIKLIQSYHPMLLGISGLAVAVICAGGLILLG